MERKIGEIFEYNGEWYQCVEQPEKYDKTFCALCAFQCNGNCELDRCSETYRSDKKSVIFKKLEKWGKPYPNADKLYQLYILPMNIEKLPTHTEGINLVRFDIVEIEIKQNKEDMEENKITFPKENNTLTRIVDAYVNEIISDKELIKLIKEMSDEYPYDKNNLKPFSLEAAKSGKPVCTRDGRKARIICFDRKLFYRKVSYPILALVERSDGEDDVCGYNEKGKVLIEDGAEYKDDLMMLPEKRSGWVNVYKGSLCISVYPRIYKSREEAISDNTAVNRIDTVKISWEE